MRPPTSGIQASAAAMLDGSPVDCVAGLSTRGGVSDGVGGIGSGGGAASSGAAPVAFTGLTAAPSPGTPPCDRVYRALRAYLLDFVAQSGEPS